MSQQTHPAVPTRDLKGDLHGAVVRAVVDDKHLQIPQGLIQHRTDALGDVFLGVVKRYDNTYHASTVGHVDIARKKIL
jgi:hypothetical protein